jgi:hypothetical protein
MSYYYSWIDTFTADAEVLGIVFGFKPFEAKTAKILSKTEIKPHSMATNVNVATQIF